MEYEKVREEALLYAKVRKALKKGENKKAEEYKMLFEQKKAERREREKEIEMANKPLTIEELKKDVDYLLSEQIKAIENGEDTHKIKIELDKKLRLLEKARDKRSKERSKKKEEIYMEEKAMPKIKLSYNGIY